MKLLRAYTYRGRHRRPRQPAGHLTAGLTLIYAAYLR